MTAALSIKPNDIISTSSFKRVLDRSEPIDDLSEALRDHWSYNLEERRPGPAILHDGTLTATDLDLACLLSTLANRHAVVTLPKYFGSGTKKSAGTTQQVLDGDRRGKLLRLTSNKEFFSFSALVQDMAVQDLSTGELGAPRAFHIVGKDGRWHPGWESIKFIPNAKENDFIEKYGLAVNASVAFNTFVAPGRWTAFYGQYYAMTKLVIDRHEEAARAIRAAIKERKARTAQVEPPTAARKFAVDTDENESFSSNTITVPVFEAELSADWTGETPAIGRDSSLDGLQEQLRYLEGSLAELRFATRATELAFYKARGEKASLPAWIRGFWADETIKRTTWRRMGYNALALPGMALRYRIRAKDIEVAAR